MWHLWRKPLVLVHFFAMVLTITSSIATMTTDLDPATWQDAAAAGGNTRPQLRLTPGASSETDAFKLLPRPGSDTIGVASSSLSLEHQRNASSSSAASGDAQDKGKAAADGGANEQDFIEDYVISQGFSAQHTGSAHRAELVHSHERKHQKHSQLTVSPRRDNARAAPLSTADAYGGEQGNDSINLSWSVLNNASAIGQRHATVPESVSGSDRTTNVNISRSLSSDNSEEEDEQDEASASSKVIIESIQRRRSSAAMRWNGDDSNRDNGVAFGSSSSSNVDDTPSSSLVALGDEAAVGESGEAALPPKWTGQSGASSSSRRRTSRRHDIHDVRNNRTTSSSAAGAGAAASKTRQLSDDSSAVFEGESRLTSAALTADGKDELEEDSQARNTNRNAISGDAETSLSEVRRQNNNDTMATNAKLIAEEKPTRGSPQQNEKTFGHNNITRASTTTATTSSLEAGLMSRGREQAAAAAAAAEDGSISATTMLSTALPPQQQHRQSAVLVGGGAGATRNKSATSHNSIRALNHISERKPYFGKHHHNNDKYGPHFEDIKTVGNVTNMTVQMGQSVYLNCRISLLQDKTVSWMRRLVGENELQLLTVGNNTYSGDSRYAVHYQYPHNWRLKITKLQVADEGSYVCQLSTHPPRVIQYNLHINAPQVMIIDEAGLPLQDKYYEVDSTIQLSCIVRDVKMATSVVYWNHSDQILNYDITRGGISVKTDLMGNGANSTILVARVNKSDSGNYSCSISPDQFYTVTVHVLNGESYAELHHGNGTTIHRCWPSSLLWASGLLLALLHILINAHEWNFNGRGGR